VRGIPDIIGVISGRFIAIELKAPNGKLDKLQEYTLSKIREAGGFAEVIDEESFEKILHMLHLLRK
jgi:hypothetical protein